MEKKVYVSPKSDAIQLNLDELMQTVHTSSPDEEPASRQLKHDSSWDQD